jgi:DNA-binding transcriptional ArsR family regulator
MSATRATNHPRDPNVSAQAVNAEFFRALGHPVRVRVLEQLRANQEMSVRDLQTALHIESGGASHHLSAMRRHGLLAARRQGTSVFYRVRDPRTFQLLGISRQILTSHFRYTQTLLDDLNDAGPTSSVTRSPPVPRVSP